MKKNTNPNQMDIYSKKQKWKFLLLAFAIVIGFSSLFVTNKLVKELKTEERKKIELWAYATKQLVNIYGEGDYSLSIKVISENSNIPVILVDDCDSILQHRNFDNNTSFNKILIKYGLLKKNEITKSFLRNELNLIKESGDEPIRVNIPGDLQWIYYKDSALLNRLRYYPIYQLLFIAIFMIIAYLIFSASRKSEQNQVWAGMAKETAHQIGTPLSSLMAWLELLKEKNKNEEIASEMEKDIKRLEIIADRFSKIGSKPELKNTNIVSVISKLIYYLKSRLPAKTEFELNMSQNEIIIPIGPTLFAWVIENLVKNAVDAIKGNGKIIISVKESTSSVVINIKDNGDGIDKKLIKNIFKPGVTSKQRGWGLGLSLSKRIIEEYHKGSIFILESKQNIGTTFSIHLPKLNTTTA